MKKSLFFLGSFLFLFLINTSLTAQTISLCEKYEGDKPSGIYTTWDIESTGGFVYIHYKQAAMLSTSSTWYLYLDYDWEKNGKYSAYETIELKPETGKNWIVYDYKFTEGGKYKAMIMKDGVEMTSVYFQINVKPGSGTADTDDETDSDVPDTYYYENSVVEMCTGVTETGKSIGAATTFNLGSDNLIELTVLVTNDKPFKTKEFSVDVFEGPNAERVIDNYTIDVDPTWDYIYFKHKFTKTGTYIVDIYNGEDVYINTSPSFIIKP